MIKRILKYQGNENYICILCLDEKDELIVFYALTDKLTIELEANQLTEYITCCSNTVFSHLKTLEIKIPIKIIEDNVLFHIKIDSKKEYDHICSVVESLV